MKCPYATINYIKCVLEINSIVFSVFLFPFSIIVLCVSLSSFCVHMCGASDFPAWRWSVIVTIWTIRLYLYKIEFNVLSSAIDRNGVYILMVCFIFLVCECVHLNNVESANRVNVNSEGILDRIHVSSIQYTVSCYVEYYLAVLLSATVLSG